MGEFNWTCPYCQHAQTVSGEKYYVNEDQIYVGETANGRIGTRIVAIGCSNPKCKRVKISLAVGKAKLQEQKYAFSFGTLISTHEIWPESTHKPQPDFIPKVLIQDYVEASRIRDLSPKASATLARRCIQGMIRDFCEISKSRLIDEIKELSDREAKGTAPAGVNSESVEAIDHVRSIGNIGAHMEKDIDVILDVDPGEAQALLELIELLFEDWYVARNTRQEKLDRVKLIAGQKEEQKKAAAATPSE